MGTVTSKDTRRISFDNNFALAPPIIMQKSLETEHDVAFENLPLVSVKLKHQEPLDEIFFEQRTNFQDDNEPDYWTQRIDKLKEEHKEINKIVETEFDKKIESTNKVYEITKLTPERVQKLKPCFDWRAKILKCYEDNPHQPLVCSAAVQAFANCVSNCRLEE